jgi:ribonuclease R
MQKNRQQNIAEKRQKKGEIRKDKKNEQKRIKAKTISGIVRVSKSGNGFVDLPGGDSVIIPKNELAGAISGDTVRISLFPPRKDRPGDAGTVTEIIKRGTTHIAGVVDCEGKNYFIKPIKAKFPFLVHIKPGQLGGAVCGTAALAKITSWQSDIPGNIEGVISKTYGTRGEHESDMAMLIGESLEDPDFTEELLKEVHSLPDVDVEAEIKNGRRDFRKAPTCTIDPERAQDFDDALSIEENGDGTYNIGVHIADVSYYVSERSNLDTEAYRRGTSIYLVDRCIPMLPERLSNDLCSLREGVPRLTMSVMLKMEKDGNILEHWCGPGLIQSNKRFNYGEVDEILNNKNGLMYKELSTLMDLSNRLEKERQARGALVFNKDEIRFILNEAGVPTEIVREKGSPSHTLIESFMLLANSITAKTIEDWHDGLGKKRGMYRVHGQPNETAVYDLILFAKQCGIRTPATFSKPIDVFKHLLKKSAGLPIEPIFNDMIIRSQAKAHYSEINTGHFGLALKSYNHFTSPIRRYPDLVVHRILKYIIKDGNIPYNQKELHDVAEHAGNREEKATEAERASIRYKQIEYIENKIGETRTGMLVGMTDMICKIIDTETMAMVTCSPTKIRLTLGDKIEYTLDSADRLQDMLTGTITKKV